MRIGSFARLYAVALVSLSTATAGAQVQNGSFEVNNIGAGNYQYLSGLNASWTFFRGAGLINTSVGSTAFNALPAVSGDQIAFVQGNGSYIEQVLSSLSAGTYSLGFYSAGRQSGGSYDGTTSYAVSFGGIVVGNETTASYDSWRQYLITVSAAGPSVLRFENTSAAGDHTFFIDDVSLTAVTSTPEPASMALLATGLIGVAGVVRRKHSA
jgi:hypothetical protein